MTTLVFLESHDGELTKGALGVLGKAASLGGGSVTVCGVEGLCVGGRVDQTNRPNPIRSLSAESADRIATPAASIAMFAAPEIAAPAGEPLFTPASQKPTTAKIMMKAMAATS